MILPSLHCLETLSQCDSFLSFFFRPFCWFPLLDGVEFHLCQYLQTVQFVYKFENIGIVPIHNVLEILMETFTAIGGTWSVNLICEAQSDGGKSFPSM